MERKGYSDFSFGTGKEVGERKGGREERNGRKERKRSEREENRKKRT